VYKDYKKPWEGRFTEETDPLVEEFTSSIHFDRRLYKADIAGSIAHAEMLAKQGLITEKEAKKIVKALKEIEKEIENGEFPFSKELEDIHMNIEARLIEKIGDTGKKLHTGRSRNDQVALDLRIYLKDETGKILKGIFDLQSIILKIATQHMDYVMPGYTHLQRAMPVLLSHHLLAYFEMLTRDWRRFFFTLNSIDFMPLGAGAIAGSSLPLDRKFVAKKLGFSHITANSMDSVSDRDFALDFLYSSAILMMHLSRFAEEIILWCTQEFGFVDLPDRLATGSSMMPNKKNPDVLELIRGKSGRVYGNLLALLVVMKGLPLTYNRDMQEDKEAVFDSADTVRAALAVMKVLLSGIKFNKDRMRNGVDSYMQATDLAEYLVKKGIPFRTAHSIVGKIISFCYQNNRGIHELTLKELQGFSGEFQEDVLSLLSPEASIKSKITDGGTGTQRVLKQLRECKKILNNERRYIH